MKFVHKLMTFTAIQAALAAGITWGLHAADKAFPPPLDMAAERSREVLDADGQLLRAFTTRDGKWRLAVKASDVDPRYLKMLVAYEDQRFYEHDGVDLVAMGRAAFQLVTHGHIVSGASTVSMQVARLIEPHLTKALGQPVIISNRPGASGQTGTNAVVMAPADGLTLLVVASTHTVTPATDSKLPYDTAHDLAAVAMLARNPLVFVASSKVKAETLADFVALAKAEPGRLNYATPGNASALFTRVAPTVDGVAIKGSYVGK